MKFGFVTLGAVALAAAGLWSVEPATAQQGQPVSANPGAPDPTRELRLSEAAAKPTPRTSDGHPDLTGFYADPPREANIARSSDGRTLTVLERDAPELDARAQPNFKARAADTSRRPQYKKEFQAKQRELMYTASRIDPGIHCYPQGVPRIGAPAEIFQTPNTMYFFYGSEGGEDQTHTYRVIPIGGDHDKDRDPRPDGDSVARWEGETLVVDVVNLDPETWLDADGDFHDENLHVIERFTRRGDTLDYQVVVQDPTLFTEGWRPVLGQVRGRIGSTTRIARRAGEHVIPDYACVERDREHKVNNDRP